MWNTPVLRCWRCELAVADHEVYRRVKSEQRSGSRLNGWTCWASQYVCDFVRERRSQAQSKTVSGGKVAAQWRAGFGQDFMSRRRPSASDLRVSFEETREMVIFTYRPGGESSFIAATPRTA
jgi:hypothetical protein